MRITLLIFAAMTLLGLSATYLAVSRAWTSHQLVVEDGILAAMSKARSEWLEGTLALSLERSVTQVSLALDDPIPPAFEALIDEQRAESDTHFRNALAQLEAIDADIDMGEFYSSIRGLQTSVSELRAEADGLLAVAKTDRDSERMHQMPYDLKTTIEGLFSYTFLLSLPDSSTSAQEVALTRIQNLAWEAREYAGRARTFYAIAALTDQPIPDLLFGEAKIDTARGLAAWDRIQVKLQTTELPPDFVASVAAVREPFVETYMNALAAMDRTIDQKRAGEAAQYPYDFNEFFDLSNDGLNAIADIAPIAGTYIQSYWEAELAKVSQVRLINSAFALAVILASAMSMYIIRSRLTRPLSAAIKVLDDMAQGQIDRKFRKTRRNLDELKLIWDGLEALSVRLKDAREKEAADKEAEERAKQGIVGEMMKGLAAMSEGDLTYHIKNEHGDAYRDLIENYNDTCATLRQVVGDVVQTAHEMTDGSQRLFDSVGNLSNRSEDQMQIVGEATTSLRSLVEELKKTAKDTEQLLETVSSAAQRSDAGREIVDAAISAMESIRDTSENISGYGTIIDDIAFQTNLLSLNAGVEAARAGDAGKGFAVVAMEVRNLASQASDAAGQVKQPVESSKNSVLSGVDEVTKTGASLTEITEMVGDAKIRIEEIDRLSRRQSDTLAQLGTTMENVDAISRQNAEMAEDASTTSRSLQTTAHALQKSVARFKISSNGARAGQGDLSVA